MATKRRCVHPVSPWCLQSLTLASVCAEYLDRAGNTRPARKRIHSLPHIILAGCVARVRLQKLSRHLCRTGLPFTSSSPASWPQRQHDTFLSLVISSLAHTPARTGILIAGIDGWPPPLGKERCLSIPALTKTFPPDSLFFQARK